MGTSVWPLLLDGSPAERRRVELGHGHAASVLLAGGERLPPARDGGHGGLAVVIAARPPAARGAVGEEDAAHVRQAGGERLQVPPARDGGHGGLAVTLAGVLVSESPAGPAARGGAVGEEDAAREAAAAVIILLAAGIMGDHDSDERLRTSDS